jgi:catechol 2,3-dioxygenase-like lactoylglutathione lyase family enzyme
MPTTAIDEAITTPHSTLIAGVNHVAESTQDLDRLAGFYRETMDVPFVELNDGRGRHGFLLLGGNASDGLGSILHVFEVPAAIAEYGDPDAMFRRGRLDHIAIEAADEAALAEVRTRTMAAGASDGVVCVYGNWLLSLSVTDPDGMRIEVTTRWTRDVFGERDVQAG